MPDSQKEHIFDVETVLRRQWAGVCPLPRSIIEGRLLELERLGLADVEEAPGVPGALRQFAVATLQRTPDGFFITADDGLLGLREVLEGRYGTRILSVPEAAMLLDDADEPCD